VVSRHLARLREVGIVAAERRGREVHYQLTTDLAGTLRAIADALDVCCPPGACAPSSCCPPDTSQGEP
jgi:DNA-binding transcriptional ArsR family regulator